MATAIEPKVAGEVEVERESFEALEARLLVGAGERIRAFVEEAQRRGLMDAEGRRISKAVPDDMKPGADRDFGG